MRRILPALVFALMMHATALAHRVNVFAYVEGGEVVVECSYSKSKRVNRGTIEVADTIYGVSMGQDGVSKVLSLRLSDIPQN